MGTKQSKSKRNNSRNRPSKNSNSKSTIKKGKKGHGLLSYSGEGCYMGMLDKLGRRSGLGIECFGSSLSSGISYAGEWKKNLWNGYGVVFTRCNNTDKEWYVGKFKDGQIDGEAVQYDLFSVNEEIHVQGIWRRNEIVYTSFLSPKILMRCRKKAGEAMQLGRDIEACKTYETRTLEVSNVQEGRVLSIWHPSLSRTVRALITAVHHRSGTVTVRMQEDEDEDRRSLETIPFNEFISHWLRIPKPTQFFDLHRLVLPPTASLSRQFSLERLDELKNSQVNALQQTMEQQNLRQVKAFENLRRQQQQEEQEEQQEQHSNSNLNSNQFFEPTDAPPPLPYQNIVTGVVVSNRSVSGSHRDSGREGRERGSHNTINELDCLTDEEMNRMTRIDGWSERELRALGRIRRQQQQRRQEQNRRMRQVRAHHQHSEPPANYEGKYNNNNNRSSRSNRLNSNTIPQENDMLFYASHDASVDTMNDVFVFSGGLDGGIPNGYHPHSNANPFDHVDTEDRDTSSSNTTNNILDWGPPETTTRTTTNPTEGKTNVKKESASAKLKRLQRYRKERDSKEKKQCSICLDDIRSKNDTRMLSCAHTFHGSCVGEWLKRSNVCPLCRTEQ